MYEFCETPECISENGTQLLYVSSYSDEKFWSGSLHRHDFWEVFFCLGGSCEFFFCNESFVAQRGDFIIINPGVEHHENNLGNQWIVVAFRGIRPVLESTTAGYIKGSFLPRLDYVAQLTASLLEEARCKLPGYQDACMCTLNLLMLQIRRLKNAQISSPSAAETLPQSKYNGLGWVKQHIDNNYTHKTSVDYLARAIGLNKYSLIREFKQAYGVSPMEYLLRCRFREAKFLLSTTNLSVGNIGQGVGFSSSNYFSQSFMKREGMSPSAYRELHRGSKE